MGTRGGAKEDLVRAGDELDKLLKDRFDITSADFVAALKSLPALRPWATTLSEDEARLLDHPALGTPHRPSVSRSGRTALQQSFRRWPVLGPVPACLGRDAVSAGAVATADAPRARTADRLRIAASGYLVV